MLREWVMVEHHRLVSIEEWPEGPHKEAVLAAIQSTLKSLLQDFRTPVNQVCDVCRNRSRAIHVLDASNTRVHATPLRSIAA